MEPITYLVIFFTWYGSKQAITADIESIPQSSMEQCEANGAELKGLFSEVKYKCIEGIATNGVR